MCGGPRGKLWAGGPYIKRFASKVPVSKTSQPYFFTAMDTCLMLRPYLELAAPLVPHYAYFKWTRMKMETGSTINVDIRYRYRSSTNLVPIQDHSLCSQPVSESCRGKCMCDAEAIPVLLAVRHSPSSTGFTGPVHTSFFF